MHVKSNKIIALFLSILGFTTILAQESINTSSGENVSGEGSVSYTIGQVFYQNKTSSQGAVSEGIHQPYEISTLGTASNVQIDLIISAYPNPTPDILILDIKEPPLSNLNYQLYNALGNLILQKDVKHPKSHINMRHLPVGVYIIKVIKNNKQVKTFKILKK